MKRRGFMLVLAAGGATVALTACNSMPASAVQAWAGPPDAERDPRMRALSWAMLAPNPHNLQSWIADLRVPGQIKLHVDTTRLLPETDPPARQILIGCGAFLELLCMAAAAEGWHSEVQLFPEGEFSADRVDERPFALLRLQRNEHLSADPLFAAVPLRRTTRSNYEPRLPEGAALQALQRAVRSPGLFFELTRDAAQARRVADLAVEGYRVEFGNGPTWRESADAMRVGSQAVADEPSGISLLGTEVWWGRQLGLLTPTALRDTAGMAAQRATSTSTEAALSTPVWGWLVSSDNTRGTQLESGRAWMRVALQAAAAGLAVHPNSQVLQEFAAMAPACAAFHREAGVTAPARVQMLVRLGYAPRPEPAPRRPLARVVRA